MSSELPTEMKPVFDYGSLNDDHKKAAEEIVFILRTIGQDFIAESISQRFKLVEPKKFNLEDSKFFQSCREAGIYINIQGFLVDHSDPEKTEYPIISLSEDVRNFDRLYETIKNQKNQG